MTAILAQKGTMTQLYDEKGNVVPVTVLEADNCFVVLRRTKAKDGYDALQIGQGKPSKRRLTRAVAGHFRKSGATPTRFLREVRVADVESFQPGQKLTVAAFKPGDKVDVTGWTKGRGFASGVKRWGWRGGPATHGSMSHRRIGSVGSGTSPGRVWPGRTLPGHYGVERVTVRNLRVVKVEPERSRLYVEGAVPGGRGGELIVVKSK